MTQMSAERRSRPPGPTRKALIADIESFCGVYDMAPTDFGKRAAGDSSLLHRLKKDLSISVDRMDAIREWMANYRREKRAKR